MFSIGNWWQSRREKDAIRENTLGRLLHTCIFLPLIMILVKFITKSSEWTWFSFLFFIIVIILFGYKSEDYIFRLLNKYGYKVIKSPYSYIISTIVGFTCYILLFIKY